MPRTVLNQARQHLSALSVHVIASVFPHKLAPEKDARIFLALIGTNHRRQTCPHSRYFNKERSPFIVSPKTAFSTLFWFGWVACVAGICWFFVFFPIKNECWGHSSSLLYTLLACKNTECTEKINHVIGTLQSMMSTSVIMSFNFQVQLSQT